MLRKMAGQFSRLTAAAGFAPGELQFNHSVVPSSNFNAFHMDKTHDVTVFRGFVTCALKHEAVGPLMLAHEIGHAVQYREGIWEERED